MKKILLALMVLALAAASAFAGVGINWTTVYGAYTHDAPNVTDYPSSYQLLDFYNVTWQLIYAGADNAIDPVDLANGANGYVSDDDDVWATRSITLGGGTAPEDSTVWDDWMLWASGDTVYEDLGWSTAGSVYQRIYEGDPASLSWYFDTGLLALNTGYTGSPALPQDFFVDTGSAGFQPDQQIPAVPEPATMGLLGLGALVMAIRRRRA